MKQVKIFPSLISGNLLNLEKQIKELEPHCAGFHLDVMDFHFVPNLTWGIQFVNAIRKITKKQIWVDLLVDEPEYYLNKLALNNDDIISIHYESSYPDTIFAKIQKMGLQASLALDPKTPLEVIEPFIKKIDQVLLMSVQPGFSGQAFIMNSVERIKQLDALRTKQKADFTIAMDGGINESTLPLVLPYGLDMVGIASGIFDHTDPVKALETLQKIN